MEIGESLVGAYLRQILGCKVVLYNTYLPEGQGEVDVIGIKKDDSGNQVIYLVEVTTHILGMLYKDEAHTVEKVLKKKATAEKFAAEMFEGDRVSFEVWSPVVAPKLLEKLNAAGVRMVANEEFTKAVNQLAVHAAKSTKTTGDDGYRFLQILTHLKGDTPIFNWGLGNDESDLAPLQRVYVPGPKASSGAVHQFAHTYNGYKRIRGNENELSAVYQPHNLQFDLTGRIDKDLGIDFLRGWLFYLARQDRIVEGSWDASEPLWRAICKAIREKAGSTVLNMADPDQTGF